MLNKKKIITIALLIFLIYLIFNVILFILLLLAIVLPVWIILLRVSDGVKFRDMPKYFYNIVSNPLQRIVFPIIRIIFMWVAICGIFLFMGIFYPFIMQVRNFMKFGNWETITFSDFLSTKLININYFDIPSWRGIEKILNWIFFEASASLTIFIFFMIYIFFVYIAYSLIDEKIISKIFNDDSQ